jgi:cytidyltransferase-like protein
MGAPKKVFISGCYDLLHSGHVQFFTEAAKFGDLYVALGSDQTIYNLKHRPTAMPEQERLFMVRSIKGVKEAFISSGSGHLDFEPELREIKPDFFLVNSDGDSSSKRALCKELGIEYVVLERTPQAGLPARSTTALRSSCQIPFRIDLAGGWLDQPFVSKYCPGPVITLSINPDHDFNERSGMASSTRRSAISLWGSKIPPGDTETLAKSLFCFDNPPGTTEISGSQDAIGIVYPGLAKATYSGNYWPESIEHSCHEELLEFIENSIYLIPLGARAAGYSVLENTKINKTNAQELAHAAEHCWQAIQNRDLKNFGAAVRHSFEAQIRMFPNMLESRTSQQLEQYQESVLGWKLSGAGGGGYLILVSDKPIAGALKIEARRG